jgi:hypothetical protein
MMPRDDQSDALRKAMRQAKTSAMRERSPEPAELIWWRAQLRKRQAAMEKMSAPTRGVQTFTAALLLVLAIVITIVGSNSWVHSAGLLLSRAGIAAMAIVLLLAGVLVYLTLAPE